MTNPASRPTGPLSRTEALTAMTAAGAPETGARFALARAYAQPGLTVPAPSPHGDIEVTWWPGSHAPGGDFTLAAPGALAPHPGIGRVADAAILAVAADVLRGLGDADLAAELDLRAGAAARLCGAATGV